MIFRDVPEIHGLAATTITHNTNNLGISTFIFLFRTLIGLSLIKMVMVLVKNGRKAWCPVRDSNPQPPDYKSGALPVELTGRALVSVT